MWKYVPNNERGYNCNPPFIIGTPKSGKLHSFDMVLIKNQEEVPRVIIAMLSDYTLWHRRMGHAHQRADIPRMRQRSVEMET